MEKDKKVKRWIGHIEHWQIIAVFLMAYDFVAICASYFLALFLRFCGAYRINMRNAYKTVLYG